MLIPETFRRIGVFAPAGKLAPELFQSGAELLEAEGKSVRVAPHVRQEYPVRYLAASAESRAEELTRLWLDPEIDLLLAARFGGPVRMNFPFGHVFPFASLNCRQLVALESDRICCC